MSDIEGSTRLLQALGDRYAAVLDDHYRILDGACTAAGGSQVSTDGDATFSRLRRHRPRCARPSRRSGGSNPTRGRRV
jgi:class 3 adenylate cyclase